MSVLSVFLVRCFNLFFILSVLICLDCLFYFNYLDDLDFYIFYYLDYFDYIFSDLSLSFFVSTPLISAPCLHLFISLVVYLLDYLGLNEYLLACYLIALIYLSLIIGLFIYIIDLDIGIFVRMSTNIIDKYYNGKMVCSLLNPLLEVAGPL